jgi:hypothetical protein
MRMGRTAYSAAADGALALGMAEDAALEPSLHMLSWFSEEELKVCPYCDEKAAVPRQSGPSVCLACEAVWIDGSDASQGSQRL